MIPFYKNKQDIMQRKSLFIIIFHLLIFTTSTAQHTITGQIKPVENLKTMLLYKTEGAFQYYKASSKIDSLGLFGFALPKEFENGSYKLVYDTRNNNYVNIIFNNENISFVFDPKNLINTIHFYDSEENTLFFDYVRTINKRYLELDSIQKAYYENPREDLQNKYIYKRKEIDAYQNYFEKQSKGKIANHFIKSFVKYLSKTPLNSKKEYYSLLKDNYLSSINFQDSVLRNSSFILDRLIEYVFDLNEITARKNKTKLDVKMIDKALSKIEPSKFKDEVIYSLTSSAFDPYKSTYDILLNHLYNKYYIKLPKEAKTESFTKKVKAKLKVIVGKQAPMFNFEKGNLYEIQEDTTLLIFWSTTCSHCLIEAPKIYEALKTRKNLKIIMIGLEDEYSDWENVSVSFPKSIQIQSKGKWDSEMAKKYNVKGTPSYFILDKNKKIILKPEKIKELSHFFNINISK